MEVYNSLFPYIVLLISSIAAIVLLIGGAYTGYSWAVAPTDMNNSKAGNLYAGIWVFVGSSLAAMACLWIAKQILSH